MEHLGGFLGDDGYSAYPSAWMRAYYNGFDNKLILDGDRI